MSSNSKKTGAPPKPVMLSTRALILLIVSAVLSLRALPSQAEEGFSIIFYLVVGALVFFIPAALISAELASAWPQDGGVYLWVKQAFGPRAGFVAIFMQWVENLPWFPSMLTFVASGLAFIVNPKLAENKYFVFVSVLVLLWLGTWLNTKGMKWSAFLSSTGATAGVLIPGVLLIVSAVVYLALGNAPAIEFSFQALIPDLGNLRQLMLLVGMLVGLAGIELSAVHIREVDNPTKNFPKATLIATGMIIVINILASLSIAVIVPAGKITASEGLFEAFKEVLSKFGLHWMMPVICIMLAYGGFAAVATWLLGPSKGLLEVAKEGYMPTFWQKRNKNGTPINILLAQSTLSSVIALSILFAPTVADAFVQMTALTALLYMVMYVLMFAAVIKLRYSQPDVVRPYKIGGGKIGIWIVAGIAILASVLVVAFGFIPPAEVTSLGARIGYWAFLAGGAVLFISVPLLFYRNALKKHTVKPENKETVPESSLEKPQ
ncbi:MAG: amino acid permease [Ruthenibacterium sp.]